MKRSLDRFAVLKYSQIAAAETHLLLLQSLRLLGGGDVRRLRRDTCDHEH